MDVRVEWHSMQSTDIMTAPKRAIVLRAPGRVCQIDIYDGLSEMTIRSPAFNAAIQQAARELAEMTTDPTNLRLLPHWTASRFADDIAAHVCEEVWPLYLVAASEYEALAHGI